MASFTHGSLGKPPLFERTLAARMGIPYLRKYSMEIEIPVVDPSDLSYVNEVWPHFLKMVTVFGSHGDTLDVGALLAGLYRSGQWKRCLDDVDASYAIASNLCFFTKTYRPVYPHDLSARDDILALLNEWIKPTVAWTDIPNVLVVAEALFGPPWRALVLETDDDDPGRVCEVVASERPPFVHGLCLAQEIVSLSLPELAP
jgi:hypothetical protein